jgi:hypothetical protein
MYLKLQMIVGVKGSVIRWLGRFSCALLLPGIVFAQSGSFHRNNITVAIGAGVPVGSDTAYLDAAPLISVGYGYRLNQFLQADVGFQTAFGAASNQNIEATNLGYVRGGDREYMIPLGGRFVIPTPLPRIEVSAGGGAVHLHYSETVPSSYYYTNYCYSCTSRGGWGAYGLANVSYFLDSDHNFHVGTTGQFISASLHGDAVGATPAINTKDHWVNVSFEFGFSF